jgi:hypothetical protein
MEHAEGLIKIKKNNVDKKTCVVCTMSLTPET